MVEDFSSKPSETKFQWDKWIHWLYPTECPKFSIPLQGFVLLFLYFIMNPSSYNRFSRGHLFTPLTMASCHAGGNFSTPLLCSTDRTKNFLFLSLCADSLSPPINVTIKEVKANSAVVSWDIPEGDLVIGFAITQQVRNRCGTEIHNLCLSSWCV